MFDNNIASYLNQGNQLKDPKLYDLLSRLIKATTELYNASSINSGILNDERLSDNVPLIKHGNWTPVDASGAALVFTNVTGRYVKLDRLIICFFTLTYPVTVSGANNTIVGLPYTSENTTNYIFGGYVSRTNLNLALTLRQIANSKGFYFETLADVPYTNIQLSAIVFEGTIVYRIP